MAIGQNGCGAYETKSQGFYGSPNGASFLSAPFAALAGADGIYEVGTGYQLTFSSPAAIVAYLPAGGTAGILSSSLADPTSTPAGVFGGQVLTMRLNVDLSNLGVLPPGLGALIVNSTQYDGSGTSFLGKSVSTIVAEGEQVLGSGPQASASVYNVILSDLVAAFDGANAGTSPGATASAFLSCPNGKDPIVSGMKYYDANANGQLDAGEVGIPAWPINYNGTATASIRTTEGGTFSVNLASGSFTFAEVQASNSFPAGPWFQTGNIVDQTITSGGATSRLTGKQYAMSLPDSSTVQGVSFGNLCLGGGGGHTIGYWKNLRSTSVATLYNPWQSSLVALHLVNSNGSAFDPASYSAFSTWLGGANATNMAHMLSAQLAAMELSVRNGFVQPSRLIYAPGTQSANSGGFAALQAVMNEADAALAADGHTPAGDSARSYQEALKNALDNANNNRTFVAPGFADCPTPVFPAAPEQNAGT